MASGFLRVRGTQIVDGSGNPKTLKGTCLGGWMNMENFMNGFPGRECTAREAMLKVMGQKKYDYFFDRFLYHFFGEKDAEFLRGLGFNCLRLGFNYRHFEDDMNPRVLKDSGFTHLDRVIRLCAKYGIYTILDLHAVPGGQNPDWHSDNRSTYSAFWDYKDHQDRVIWLWEQLVKRYKDNTWIAGFNPMNEPCDPEHIRLVAFYDRLERSIRAIDPHHILFLEGNTFSMEWKGFDKILPNCVYSIHDYSMMGFPVGELYKGTLQQKAKIESQFLRKCEFQLQNKVPIWNGEFGPVYADPRFDDDAENVNECRYALLGEQLRLYEKHGISWTTWNYKDMGTMGTVYTSPESPWCRLTHDMIVKKRELQLDSCGMIPAKAIDAVIVPMVEWIDSVSPAAKETYPSNWNTRNHVERLVIYGFLAQSFTSEFGDLFRGKDEEELEELAQSFRFDQCVQRGNLNKILSQHVLPGGVK